MGREIERQREGDREIERRESQRHRDIGKGEREIELRGEMGGGNERERKGEVLGEVFH